MVDNRVMITILGSAIVTYFTKFPLLVISGGNKIPEKLRKYLSFIAPAILTALIAPSIFTVEGKLDLSINNYYLPAAVITVILAYFSKSMLASIIVGLSSVALMSWLF